jgi:Zn-dependent M28 family amino/carboxypeptidase
LWLCWFDGEEAYREWSDTDGLYGSKAMVAHLKASGTFDRVRAMINLDMIGDCDLDVHKDVDAAPVLVDTIWSAARRAGYRKQFTVRPISIDDDHVPFRDAGVPAIDIIDFRMGGGAVEHQMNWHTPRDTLELVCAESLQAVGDVMLTALPDLDAALARGGPNE